MKHSALLSACLRAGICLVLLLSAHASHGQTVKTVDLNSGKVIDGSKAVMPSRDVDINEKSIVVTYSFNSAVVHPNPRMEGTKFLKIQGFGLNTVEGEPALPVRWDSFVLPCDTKYDIIVIDSSYVEIPIALTPAREPDVITSKGDSEKEWKPIKPYNGWFPQNLTSLASSQKYKDNVILDVRVCPVQYNYEEGRARIYTKIVYSVNNINSGNIKEFFNQKDSKIRKIDSYLYNTTLNYGCSISKVKQGRTIPTSLQRDYLIISISEYADAVNRFANWKRTLGFTTHVELKDRGQWTTTNVQSVVNSYKNYYPNLAYLLIIGDHQDVPAKGTTTSGVVSDYNYLNTRSIISSVDNGRLSVSTLTEANIIVDKIIGYEGNPPLDSSFYNQVLNCAYFQDRDSVTETVGSPYAKRRFAQTAEDLRNYLILHGKNVERVYYAIKNSNPKYWNLGPYSNGEEIPLELQKPIFKWNGNEFDIVNAINAGKFCVIYNDHGGSHAWRDPWFRKDSIINLNNGNKLPIVFSICCETGKFNDLNCFAETFLRKENGGCVAIYAASGDGYSGYQDAMVLGMFDAIWPNPGLIPSFPGRTPNLTPTPIPTFRLGQILKQGFKRMGETWGSNYVMNERFHCFGDPSMMIYTDCPSPFSNVSISGGTDFITVDLGSESGIISFWNKSTDDVEAYEGSTANFTGVTDSVLVCISAHNKIPYIDSLSNHNFYIQNETVGGTKTYRGNQVRIGSNVTNEKPTGPVSFNGTKITIIGRKVEINGDTTIELGTEFEIKRE